MRRVYGWQRQAHDDRDLHFHAPMRLTAHLPPTFDLSSSVQIHNDQGTLGSCGPNTESEKITYLQKMTHKPVLPPSRLFMYYVTRMLMGTVNEDSGVDNRTMMKALQKYGYCNEASQGKSDASFWPYDVRMFDVKPRQACFDAAVKNTIDNYAAVQQVLPQLQGTLVAGHPFTFGFYVYAGMETDKCAATGIVPMPSKGQTPVGGHDVSAWGYTTVKQPGMKKGNIWPANTVKLLNHWTNEDGSLWGDNGFFYVPLAYALNVKLAGDWWVTNALHSLVKLLQKTSTQVEVATGN